ncbi:hypothetical protein OEZ86_009637 [Tetradesmus obliquus]|nr:hypothetical protein OEZ86_009637 [Tetradesmus obliquus]
MQISAGMFVACLFTFIRAVRFGPQSCMVASLFLTAAVMSSPSNHLGSRVMAGATLVGGMWPGAMAACVVGSLAKAAGQAGGQAAMTGVTCCLGVAVLALLAINRVGTSPPMLWALGMQSCLAFGLTSITAWRVATVAEAWATGAVIMLAAVIAAVVAVLAAALVLPTLASEQVQDIMADVLRSAGGATSRCAAHLFRPLQQQSSAGLQAGDDATAATSGLDGTAATAAAAAAALNTARKNDDSTAAGPSALSLSKQQQQQQQRQRRRQQQQHTTLRPSEELAQLARAASQLEEGYEADALAAAAAAAAAADSKAHVLAAAAANEITDAAALALMQRNSTPQSPAGAAHHSPPAADHSSSCHVSSLRPRLAQAGLLLGAAAAEPQWLRGFGVPGSKNAGLWFEPDAWRRLLQSLMLLLTRLSALEAVAEDGLSLHDSAYAMSPQLQARLRLVYSQASTSLALMAAAAGSYGRQANQQQQRGEGKDVELGSQGKDVELGRAGKDVEQQQQHRSEGKDVDLGGGSAAAGPCCRGVGMFSRSWGEAKEELAAFMLDEAERYWSSVLQAPPGSPSVVPQLTQVRHMVFTWSLTNGIVDALAELEAAAAAALSQRPPPSLVQRALSWTRPLLPLLGGLHLARNWSAVLGGKLPAALRQGPEGITAMLSQPRFQAGAKYWLVLSLVLCATLASLHFDPGLITFNPA